MNENVKYERISLIGMPGCGKTTIGKVLAREINYKFYDMDEVIVDMAKKTIKELFEEGEEVFREWEIKACKELMKLKRAVISTGGGVIKKEENIETLKENSIVVYINRPIDNILSDVDVSTRPLLNDGKERLLNLYNERVELYNKANHMEIKNDGYLRNTIDEIEKNLKGKIRE
ncbi:MAG: shikimate kinase [Clostridium sp.]